MIKLLARLFIKNHTDINSSSVRHSYGILCGLTGVVINVLLFCAKFFAGKLTLSIAMVSDAFNNLSDAASSVVSILGFKLSSKKSDSTHPFGHGRIEYIAGLIISFMILMMGFELIKSSALSLFNPSKPEGSYLALIIMALSILAKLYMYVYNHYAGKLISSPTLEAAAKDSLGDMVSTSVVIVSLILSRFTSLPVDGAAGIIVAFFILAAGFESLKETVSPLLGTAPSKEFVDLVEQTVLKHKPVCGIHDLIVHDYGPGRVMVSVHAEVPGDRDIFELHDVIDQAEYDLCKTLNCHAVIHMDPVDLSNSELSVYADFVREEVKKINPSITCHDFRVVPGNTHTNLVFDAVKPYDCDMSDEDLKKTVSDKVKERFGSVYCVINIDRPFV